MTSDHKSAHLTPSEREELAEKIQAVSPEGKPADPGMGPRSIRIMLTCVAAGIVTVGVVVSLAVSPDLGVAMAVLGLLLLLVNPSVWAAVSRARERQHVNEEQRPDEPKSV